ncbi:MAG: FmdB family transcriptional regulator [Treponema sp.]|jgi:putative FmdB family regulatory protein|nr:FmdB family transcriptional regulator [Treponema sp.]
MPTYEYECKTCGHRFDAFQSMQDDPLKICPECGKEELRRLIFGGFGTIFKGSGFYVNDKGSSKTSTSGSATSTNQACKSCPASDSGCGSGNQAAG